MSESLPSTMRRLVTEAGPDGAFALRVESADIPALGPDQVLVKVEAAPIHPSDISLLFPGSELPEDARSEGGRLSGQLSKMGRAAARGREGMPLVPGNEGAGTIVAAGSEKLEGWVGRSVAVSGGQTYAEYVAVEPQRCLPLPEGTSMDAGAAAFVNPMTALSMIEVLKRGGHSGLVHTAAASALGQMLARICVADGIPLVGVVRKDAQRDLLKEIGLEHVVSSADETFFKDLVEACRATRATLAFDAVGGGPLAGTLVAAMERVAAESMTEYSRYGSAQKKEAYIYGRLDLSPVEIPSSVGFAWTVGGFLLPQFLPTLSPETRGAMAKRVAKELETTFAVSYARTLSLEEVVQLDVAEHYLRRSTGEKMLIHPQS